MKKILIVPFIFLLLLQTSKSQQVFSIYRESGLQLKEDVQYINLPHEEVMRNDIQRQQQKSLLKSLIVAHTYKVNYTPYNCGVWAVYKDSLKIWRVGFYSKGAKSLSVVLSKFNLPKGGELILYNPSKSSLKGPFTKKNEKKTGGLPILPIEGERIIIEYRQPEHSKELPELTISKISHGFQRFKKALKDDAFGKSGSCNVNINCTEGTNWQKNKRSVVRLFIADKYCTGTLINSLRKNSKPYILTANHCIKDSAEASETIVVFNYESKSCENIDVPIDQVLKNSPSIAVGKLVSTSNKLDFSLIELSSKIPAAYNPYYAGWSLKRKGFGSATCIHHPQGDIKKISVDANEPIPYTGSFEYFDSDVHWKIEKWEVGTTEGGSSGSAIFDEEGYIFGTLSGGNASCNDPTRDYYLRFYKAWDKYPKKNRQLKYWLDPDNTGIIKNGGLDPYKDMTKISSSNCLFPNPASDYCYMNLGTEPEEKVTVSIYTTTGLLIKKKTKYSLSSKKGVIEISITNLPTGVYIIQFVSKYKRINRKILKI